MLKRICHQLERNPTIILITKLCITYFLFQIFRLRNKKKKNRSLLIPFVSIKKEIWNSLDAIYQAYESL